jgi:hypothetical protein
VGVAGVPSVLTVAPAAPGVEIRATVRVTVTVRDSCGVLVPGAPVAAVVVADSGGAVVSPAAGVTDANGQLVLDFRVGAFPGANSIRVDVAAGTNPSATAVVQAEPPARPVTYLSQNTFDPTGGVRLRIRTLEPRAVRLVVRIYNVAGELVRKVGDADVLPGLTVWEWDGRTAGGGPAANGTYFVQIVSGSAVEIKRVIVLRM